MKSLLRLATFHCVAAALAVASPAMGQLAHRYSFTADVNDSVGTAHGTIVDAGTTPNFTFSGGMLDFSANTGEASNNIVEDAYVDLPNGLVSDATTAGVNGAVAFEWWATVSETHTWSRLGDFGVSDGGEDMSPGGGNADYILIAANSGRAANGIEITNHPAGGPEPNIIVGTGETPVGVQQHVLAVYNHNDPRSFTPDGANGTMTLYVNGALVGYGGIHPNIDLRTFNDVNNWLGRSQWPDPLFDGSYNEFRIYDTAPSESYAAASFAAGPDSLATFDAWTQEFNFSFTIDRSTGEMTLSNDAGAVDVVYINIQSASGALDPNNWLSVTDNYDADSGGAFDPNDNWTIEVSTNQELSEVELSGNGGQLGMGGTLSDLQLGAAGAWTQSYHEDVVVSVQRLLSDGFTIEEFGVPVTYINGTSVERGDLDFDGDIDGADWDIFSANHLTDLSGLTVAQSSAVGDLDGDLDNDFDDFRIFQGDFDAANGEGALAALIGAVPEPSTVSLLLLAACGGICLRRNRR